MCATYPITESGCAWLQVGSVVRNAEVQALAPVLLAAIAEPNTKAKAALETLLTTTFVNTVDAASLALIVPVVHRGLRDRSGDAKKKAARIVGDMCELINEPKVCTRAASFISTTQEWVWHVEAPMDSMHLRLR